MREDGVDGEPRRDAMVELAGGELAIASLATPGGGAGETKGRTHHASARSHRA